MSDDGELLAQVRWCNEHAAPAKAEELFRAFLVSSRADALREEDAAIQTALQTFLPKRRRSLNAAYQEAVSSEPAAGETGTYGISDVYRPASDQPPVHPVHPVPAVERRTLRDHDSRQEVAREVTELPQVHELIAEAQRLNSVVAVAEAEASYLAALELLTPATVRRHQEALQAALASFLPKRRRRLEVKLNLLLSSAPEPQASVEPEPVLQPEAVRWSQPVTVGKNQPLVVRPALPPEAHPVAPPASTARPEPVQAGQSAMKPLPAITHISERLNQSLEDLSRYHIFQWSTFYRDTLAEYFETFIDDIRVAQRTSPLLNVVRSALSKHSREIFEKGYSYLRDRKEPDHYALTKSLAGLQRFLDLPLEFYSTRLASAHSDESGLALRQLSSAMLLGILNGYAQARLDQVGSAILPRYPRSWIHVTPFLIKEDLEELLGSLEPGDLVDGARDSLMPLVTSFDTVVRNNKKTAPLPALSQFIWPSRRIDVSLQLPPEAVNARLLEVQCYISGDFLNHGALEEAAARAVCAVIAPLRANLRHRVFAVERLFDIVVPTHDAGNAVDAVGHLVSNLERAAYQNDGPEAADRPITFNFAKEFPLENPFLTKYFHVYRRSVRQLMQAFERRNGVRLWCSVRRSGKTTACAADLDSTAIGTVVVSQTCDNTNPHGTVADSPSGQAADGAFFYRAICDALDAGNRLSDDFVIRTASECISGRTDGVNRIVLVLDEYETLFGTLRTQVEKDASLRYTVAQPLLNQLVAFTRDNLLVFMGQQPNAHFIFMDQNQLSPVVEQDSFPLFAHDYDSDRSEFFELVSRVMSSHVVLTTAFVNRLYQETGGHPFLTVNALVAFGDWLIETRRQVSSLSPLDEQLFEEFLVNQMTTAKIARSSQYAFFRAASVAAMSSHGRVDTPWLYAVYGVLRELALSSPASLEVTRAEALTLATRHSFGIDPEDLLSTASRANFLSVDDDRVRPKVPLLARIAASVNPVSTP